MEEGAVIEAGEATPPLLPLLAPSTRTKVSVVHVHHVGQGEDALDTPIHYVSNKDSSKEHPR